MTATRIWRRLLRGAQSGDVMRGWAEQRTTFDAAQTLVRLFYAATLYLVTTNIRSWKHWARYETLDPVWPLAWVSLTGVPTAVHLVMTATYATLIAVALVPHLRVLRVAVFVALMAYVALEYSFGRVGHGWYACLNIAFMFILLPRTTSDRGAGAVAMRQRYLLVVWAGLASLLLPYSLAGFWKVFYGIAQWSNGETHSFSPSAFAIQIAGKLAKSGTTGAAGPFLIEHPALGWLPYLGVIYIECASFIVAFRPDLHRVWGVFLIAFHIASYLTMDILFSKNVLFLVLFCVASPFAPQVVSWPLVVRALPGVGLFVSGYRWLRPVAVA